MDYVEFLKETVKNCKKRSNQVGEKPTISRSGAVGSLPGS